MTRLNSLILGSALAVGLIGLAHADGAVTGAWKLTVGVNDAPCVLTLADNGSATPTGDCSNGGAVVGEYKTIGPKILLMRSNGELFAALFQKGDTYAGTRVSDGRVVALAR
jgi:hypothetical protein